MQQQNALAAQQPQNNMQQRINQAYQLGTPQALQWAKTQEANMKPSTDVATMQGLGYPLTPEGFNAFRDAQRAEKLLTPEEEAQQLRLRASGASKTTTNVSLQGESERSKAINKLVGTKQVERFDAAQAIPSQLRKADETLDILRNSDINTGIGAEMFNTLDRARSKFASDKKAGIRVSNTEYLDALLGSEVFPLIQSLGIGARGMDTPAEREFLRAVMTGTISLDKNTLVRMTELRRNAMLDAAKDYNKRVDDGGYDEVFKAYSMPKGRIDIPKAPPKPGAAATQIPGQTASPAGVSVTLPNGQSVSFPNAAAAAQFKKAAGL
jgi:hypothetical protein